MLVCHRTSTNPYFNIAAEEYFIKNSKDDMCMFWINEPSVILGKHQSAYSEINYPYIRQNNIPVIRRISGGGAVYHDKGNINFSFIQRISSENKIDFNRFTSLIIRMLNEFGMDVHLGKRNSIFAGEKKLSGHAEHLFKDKVLHHGTILFDTNLEALRTSLTPVKKYTTKALESVRSEVTNIKPLIQNAINENQFIEMLLNWMINHYPKSENYTLSDEESTAIDELVNRKYNTWEWNYGYSPAYSFEIHLNNETVILQAKNAIISEINSDSDQLLHYFQSLIDKPHREQEIRLFAESISKFLEKKRIDIEEFICSFF